jgi:O-methyltransferase involved in polyketide biosynthesis
VVDQEPLIFRDPVAADLIGEPGAEMVGYHRRSGDHIVLAGTRAQVTVRSRWTEQRLAELAAAGITPPDGLAFVGVDLETEPLADRLAAEGFDLGGPALVSWLGVSMYLTTEAVAATLAAVGGLAAGTELAMEYALPADLRDETGAAYAGFALPVAAERREPWLSFFTPEQLSALLEAHGMTVAEQARQRDAVPAALWDRSDALRPLDLCRLARATVSP